MGICSLLPPTVAKTIRGVFPLEEAVVCGVEGGWGIFTALVLFQVPLPNSPCQTKNAPKRERHFGFIAA